MGGALIEENTTLLPLSLVLKEMILMPGVYEGSPAEAVSGATLVTRALPQRDTLAGAAGQGLVEMENQPARLALSDGPDR
jgi:hypothetical protein